MLTDKAIKALRPKSKPYKKADERGLFILVQPTGAKWWRFRYRYGGREKLLSLGVYPDTSLKLARDKRDRARFLLADGIDPSAQRAIEKAKNAETFEAVALEFLQRSKDLQPGTIAQLRQRLEKYLFPHVGSYPIRTITAPDLLRVLRRIEAKGNYETAHRCRSLCGRIFRYAIACGRADHDVAADLSDALTSVSAKHFAAITDKKGVAGLLRAIEGYEGLPSVTAALRLAPLVFVRPSELRGAEWAEFDINGRQWLIPAARMKNNRDHIVPLAKQAIAILEELQPVTGNGRLLFPSLRTSERPISENSLNAALRRLGFSKDEQTTHGFRTIASTLLHELGWDSAVIELQLAHAERNKTKAAYNRAERLPTRRKMMQAWADYLDGLKADAGAKVTALRA